MVAFVIVVIVVVIVVATVTLVLVVVTAVPRYDNFTFIDRSGRTSLYLPFHPRTLSFIRFSRSLSLSLFLILGQSFFFLSPLVYSHAECSLARFLFTVLVV